jgi:hypothetical protein
MIAFLVVSLALSLLLIPKFLEFVNEWSSVKEKLGYWGSTPQIFTLKVLYHLTPSIGFLSLCGLLLLIGFKERKGLFLALYCVLPVLILNTAAAFEINVSAKYVFFTLPGLLIAASYLCVFITKHLPSRNGLIGLAIIGCTALPSLQTDHLYFGAGYGNRDRLGEAITFFKDHYSPNDLIFPLSFFRNQEEAIFYFKNTSEFIGLNLNDEQFIFPRSPEDINPGKRMWIFTIGKSIPPKATGFYKWISDKTRLFVEFKANKGPDDNTVRVYLHTP